MELLVHTLSSTTGTLPNLHRCWYNLPAGSSFPVLNRAFNSDKKPLDPKRPHETQEQVVKDTGISTHIVRDACFQYRKDGKLSYAEVQMTKLQLAFETFGLSTDQNWPFEATTAFTRLCIGRQTVGQKKNKWFNRIIRGELGPNAFDQQMVHYSERLTTSRLALQGSTRHVSL